VHLKGFWFIKKEEKSALQEAFLQDMMSISMRLGSSRGTIQESSWLDTML
jgi:hypothetical protein